MGTELGCLDFYVGGVTLRSWSEITTKGQRTPLRPFCFQELLLCHSVPGCNTEGKKASITRVRVISDPAQQQHSWKSSSTAQIMLATCNELSNTRQTTAQRCFLECPLFCSTLRCLCYEETPYSIQTFPTTALSIVACTSAKQPPNLCKLEDHNRAPRTDPKTYSRRGTMQPKDGVLQTTNSL